MAVLAALTIPTIRGRLQTGEAEAIVNELQNIQTAINTYKSDVGKYPNNLTYLSQLPGTPLDGCGNTMQAFQTQNYRGPYINRTLASGAANYVLPAGDTVFTAYATNPLSSATTIDIQIAGVDSTVATRVDEEIDGTNDNSAGMLTWSGNGQTTLVVYHIPFAWGWK